MFIEINGRIWDYEEYKRQIILVKNYSKHSLKEALKPHGFVQQDGQFYNRDLDLVVELEFRKKEDIRMV